MGLERCHPSPSRRNGQVLEEQSSQPPPLEGVGDHEGDFRPARPGQAVVAGDRAQAAVDLGDQGQAVAVVDPGEAFDLLLTQMGVGPEEPPVDRLAGQVLVEGRQGLGVGRANRPDVTYRAVGQQDVTLALCGIAAGRLGGLGSCHGFVSSVIKTLRTERLTPTGSNDPSCSPPAALSVPFPYGEVVTAVEIGVVARWRGQANDIRFCLWEDRTNDCR